METDFKTKTTMNRLLPRLRENFERLCGGLPDDWQAFEARLTRHFPDLFDLYYTLYKGEYDFYFHLEELLLTMAKMWAARLESLKDLDGERESHPLWFESQEMLGGVAYVDLFAGDLDGLRSKLPYLQELGLTYLHLMPLYSIPAGESDGGYAVSSYRRVNPSLGTTDQLAALAAELRSRGISLALDLVFNHTSDEHEWALRAQAGEVEYENYYRMFSDRAMPDAYEKHLREIFPDEHPGAFSYRPEIDRWVWTTFHSYQWDLNYTNPAVFTRMVEEMLFLANIGVEVLRLDAVAFVWKELGTNCENLPGAHTLIQAFNAVTRIAAPAVVFKSEAIVHPDEVARYILLQECQLSYNPLLMALLWNTLATRDTGLLTDALRRRFAIPEGCAWVNYVRVHDDIGWTFDDADAARLGIHGYDHRRFLNSFYTGRFSGSFARGLPFQENPKTGDMRISGTCASLAGLEKALLEETEREVELAIRRILLLHAVILTVGGIPLFYLGDEIGTLNDYTYSLDPSKQNDSRWVHRPRMDWERAERRNDPQTIEGRIFGGLLNLITMRKLNPGFAGSKLQVMDTGSGQVLGYVRLGGDQRILVFANFSETVQTIPANVLRLYGLGYAFINLSNGEAVGLRDLTLEPFDFVCLAEKSTR